MSDQVTYPFVYGSNIAYYNGALYVLPASGRTLTGGDEVYVREVNLTGMEEKPNE